ncbi:hypothetical protein F7725_004032 [Dissostichus mawsoni]|uniref:Phosphoribosyl pyrophosphate synthase-associated protein 2 n=1 Tax=Dissostichus mawsoni TaxID=36200 RepID=A0A7J5YBX5_DISMA|nr:hypothetical protein F7725_004032 [Dissostichus mawsoni]
MLQAIIPLSLAAGLQNDRLIGRLEHTPTAAGITGGELRILARFNMTNHSQWLSAANSASQTDSWGGKTLTGRGGGRGQRNRETEISFCTVSRSSVFTACSSSWSFPISESRYSRSILRHTAALQPSRGCVFRGYKNSLLPPSLVLFSRLEETLWSSGGGREDRLWGGGMLSCSPRLVHGGFGEVGRGSLQIPVRNSFSVPRKTTVSKTTEAGDGYRRRGRHVTRTSRHCAWLIVRAEIGWREGGGYLSVQLQVERGWGYLSVQLQVERGGGYLSVQLQVERGGVICLSSCSGEGGGVICLSSCRKGSAQPGCPGILCLSAGRAASAPPERLGVELGKVQVYQEANRETRVQIQESVRGKDVFVIQTMSKDVNTTIMEMLILVYACRTSCARSITGVLPYFPYSKQCKMRKRGSIVTKLV